MARERKRRPQAAPLFLSAASSPTGEPPLRRLRERGHVRLGGGKGALAVGPDRIELVLCLLQQNDGGLAVLSALVGEFDGGVQGLPLGREGSLLIGRFHRPLPLALEHDELDERHLVEPAEKPDQQDDGNRNSDQPE